MGSGASVLALLGALACAPDGAPPPAAEPTPMPLVLPTFVLGVYEEMEDVDGRWLVREGCAGPAATLRIEEQGRIVLEGTAGAAQVLQATAVDLRSDASIALPWAGSSGSGTLELREAEAEQYLVTGLPGRGRLRFARVGSLEGAIGPVEHLLPPAADCGAKVDLGRLERLSGRTFVRGGDPCVTVGLRLVAWPPALEQAGERWPVRAASAREALTWLTVEREAGHLMGVGIEALDGGGLRLWLPSAEGMHPEELSERRGRCQP